MPIIITRGLGDNGPGTISQLLGTIGYGGFLVAGTVVAYVHSRDAYHVDVVFNVPVNETDASDPAKYAIIPGLTVLEAVKFTDAWYMLTTTRQTLNLSYLLTISTIAPRD